MSTLLLPALVLGAFSGGDGWLGLDRDIAALSGSAAQDDAGLFLEGFLRASYINSGDVSVGGNDLSGFSLDNARLKASGGVGEFTVFLELEGSSDNMNPSVGKGGAFRSGPFGGTGTGASATLLDAYAEWAFHENYSLTVGQFRPWTFHDGQLDPIDQMFIDRSFNSEWWAFRDVGAMVSGVYEQFNWYAGLQNGRDGVGDELAYFGRVDYAALGEVRDLSAGGFGVAKDANNLTVGLGYYDDTARGDGDFVSVDGEWQGYNATVVAEIGLYGDDYLNGSGPTIWSVAGAYMLQPDQWEVALRYEDLDDVGNRDGILTGGVTRYLDGQNRKLQLNVSQVSANSDITVVQLGMSMGF